MANKKATKKVKSKAVRPAKKPAIKTPRLTKRELNLLGSLYSGFLHFAEGKLKPKRRIDLNMPKELLHNTMIRLRDTVFKNRKLIDVFVKENPNKHTPQELAIVSQWKYARVGWCYIIRCMKHHAEFLGSTSKFRLTNEVFVVHSRGESFEQIVHMPLPVFVRTVLLPFKDKIIFDGILEFAAKDLGDDVRQSLLGCCIYLKKHVGVITSLPDERGNTRKGHRSVL